MKILAISDEESAYLWDYYTPDKLREYDFLTHILPVSARFGDGLDELEQLLAECLPEGPMYFPEEMYTDQSERAILAEVIRERR